MTTAILATKLYIPKPSSRVVVHPRLLQQLAIGTNDKKLTLVSAAPAGFGKTTLVSGWLGSTDDLSRAAI